jgi:ACS family hexuronate transporter-like MFS transporter
MIALSQISFSLISDRLYKKSLDITRSRVFFLGSLLSLAALCYLSGAMVTSNVLAVILLSLGLMLSCVTLVIGPALLIHLKSASHQGKIQGWFMAIASLGGIIAPFVTGVFVEKAATLAIGYQYSFFFTAG